jgi:hypothetical protein
VHSGSTSRGVGGIASVVRKCTPLRCTCLGSCQWLLCIICELSKVAAILRPTSPVYYCVKSKAYIVVFYLAWF